MDTAVSTGDSFPVSIAYYLKRCGNIREWSDDEQLYENIVDSDLSAEQKCEYLIELLERLDSAVAFDDFQDLLRQQYLTEYLAATPAEVEELRRDTISSFGEVSPLTLTISSGRPVAVAMPLAVEKARDCLQQFYLRKTLRRNSTYRRPQKGKRAKAEKMEDIFVDVTIVADDDVMEVFDKSPTPSAKPEDRGKGRRRAAENSMSHVYQRLAGSRKSFELQLLFDPLPEDIDDLSSWPCRVLAVASAGSGKTFLFTIKIPHDWACSDLWPGFDLLHIVFLHDTAARLASNTAELLQLTMLGLSPAEQADVVEYVHANTERVCIIFDGLDECSPLDCSYFVQQVLYNRCHCLDGVRVIITSRPCIATNILSNKIGVDRRLEVVGFSPDSVLDFVGKYLDADSSAAMKKELETRPDIASMMTVPFCARLTCDLFCKTATLPQCMTEVFERVTLGILQSSAPEFESAFGTLKTAPQEMQDELAMLAEFAFDMLKRRKLVFGADKLQKANVNKGITPGFFVSTDTQNAQGFEQFRFSHVSLQEFLAALHLAWLNLTPAQATMRLVELGTFDGQYNTFWQFVSGLVATDVAIELAESFLNFNVKPTASTSTAVFTSQNSSAATIGPQRMRRSRPASVSEVLRHQLTNIHQSPEPASLASASTREQRLARQVQESLSLRRWLVRLFKPIRRVANNRLHFTSNNITLQRTASEEAAVVSPRNAIQKRNAATPLTRLMVYGCYHEHVTYKLGNSSAHEHANGDAQASCNSSHQSPRATTTMTTRHSQRKQMAWDSLEDSLAEYGLTFVNYNLQVTDCRAISTVLVHHGDAVKRVLISSCSIGDNGFRQLLPGLGSCSHLVELSLNGNDLSSASNAAALRHVISNSANTLEAFDISSNPVLGSTIERVFDGLLDVRTLRHLYLHETGMTSVSCHELNRLLMNMVCLHTLWLDGNCIGDAGFASLTSGLQHSSQLCVLRLGDLALTPVSFHALAAIFPFLKKLDELYLHQNDFTTSKLDTVAVKAQGVFARSMLSTATAYPDRSFSFLALPSTCSAELKADMEQLQELCGSHLRVVYI